MYKNLSWPARRLYSDRAVARIGVGHSGCLAMNTKCRWKSRRSNLDIEFVRTGGLDSRAMTVLVLFSRRPKPHRHQIQFDRFASARRRLDVLHIGEALLDA